MQKYIVGRRACSWNSCCCIDPTLTLADQELHQATYLEVLTLQLRNFIFNYILCFTCTNKQRIAIQLPIDTYNRKCVLSRIYGSDFEFEFFPTWYILTVLSHSPIVLSTVHGTPAVGIRLVFSWKLTFSRLNSAPELLNQLRPTHTIIQPYILWVESTTSYSLMVIFKDLFVLEYKLNVNAQSYSISCVLRNCYIVRILHSIGARIQLRISPLPIMLAVPYN